MVRAQLTAWSERRSQAGAAVVIIGVPPPVGAVLGCGELQYSGPHRHPWLCAAILALRESLPAGRWINYRVVGEGVLCSVHGPRPGMLCHHP